MENEESFSSGTALLFAVISFILYWLFLRPTAAPADPRTATPATTTTTSTPRTVRPRPRPVPPEAPHVAPTPATMMLSDAAVEILNECQAKPSHVVTSISATGLGGSNVILSESGLVAFSHTQAASVVALDAAAAVRQERAKILSRLCAGGGVSPPPSKGSTLVLSISQADMNHADTLRRVLYALGTFYNLVVIVAVGDGSSSKSEKDLKSSLVEQLLQSTDTRLTEQVLPLHRVILASTVTGRVALVRQLNKVAMVVDWDPEVETQLKRFGYKVSLVPEWSRLLD